jgi:hypothetical protein
MKGHMNRHCFVTSRAPAPLDFLLARGVSARRVLFIAEGHYRIDERRTMRRKKRGQSCHRDCWEIVGPEAVKQA